MCIMSWDYWLKLDFDRCGFACGRCSQHFDLPGPVPRGDDGGTSAMVRLHSESDCDAEIRRQLHMNRLEFKDLRTSLDVSVKWDTHPPDGVTFVSTGAEFTLTKDQLRCVCRAVLGAL